MRFSKGSKVEVLCKHGVPSVSWRPAEVVCSNRYYVTVRYDVLGAADEDIVERVPRNFIRPRPPALRSHGNWFPGDIIEVMHSFSWKMAAVLKVLTKNHYMVRLVGSSIEFEVHKVDTRLRQSWLDGEWILVGQGSGNHKDRTCNELSSRNYYQLSSSQVKKVKRKLDSCEENDYVTNYSRANFQDVSLKTRKRWSPYCDPYGKTHQGAWQSWLVEKDGKYNQAAALDTSQVPEKVDNFGGARKMLGQYQMCFLVENGMTNLAEKNVERIRMQGENMNHCSRSPQHNDPDASSVGSCSISGSNPLKWHSRISSCPFGNANDNSSDAESAFLLRNDDKNHLVSNEELAAQIHRLELRAYRCTMEALHASGPLSWEQESLITNLRISLHISNDEHLMELRNLISDATSYPLK